MKIPTSFTCAGHTVKVRIVAQGKWRYGKNVDAIYDHEKLLIAIRGGLTGTVREQRFFHELVHCVLRNANYLKIDNDEIFVDNVANLLHQSLHTAIYASKKPARRKVRQNRVEAPVAQDADGSHIPHVRTDTQPVSGTDAASSPVLRAKVPDVERIS